MKKVLIGLFAVILIPIIAGLIWFLLDRTTLGRKMYAVGGNAEASRYAGIDVKRIRLIAFEKPSSACWLRLGSTSPRRKRLCRTMAHRPCHADHRADPRFLQILGPFHSS